MGSNKEQLISQLLTLANSLVGTKETAPNKGPMVEKFQRAVDGKADGESWCLGFIQYCVNEVCATNGLKNPLFKTEHTLTLWDKTPNTLKSQRPTRGSIAVWQHYKEGKPTMQGHVGIVNNYLPGSFFSIEGNTSDGKGINRDGDGVYLRKRSLQSTESFKLLGFVTIWS